MTCSTTTPTKVTSAQSEFAADVAVGLSRATKTLPSKYFYDQRGSQLFDQICELPEYYPTRTELGIMRKFAPEMGRQIGSGAMVIEFGSGSSVKTRILLDHLIDPVAYVPVDVSYEHLHETARGLTKAYASLDVLPVCADFTRPFELPTATLPETHDAVYFPGSTIGNFEQSEALGLLEHIVSLCGSGGGLLVGIDLQKDADVLEAAYNDAQGVTAEFNLNLLRRINRELGGNFELERFRHLAVYNPDIGRIEMYLESLVEQSVAVCGETYAFRAGERICTEYSHKYTVDGFAAMAESVGLTLRRQWLDDREYFAVLHLALLD